MTVIIDRFEDDVAVIELENGQLLQVPRRLFPAEAREGDVISVAVDHTETETRRKKIDALMKDVWAD